MGRVPHRSRPAFTLVELLIVVLLIGVLAALLLPAIQQAQDIARQATSRSQLHAVSNAIEQYQMTYSAYPGYFSEYDLPNMDLWTSSQNLALSLLGRVVQQGNAQGQAYQPDGAPSWFTSNFTIDLQRVGTGPQARQGRAREAFYSASTGELAVAAPADSDGEVSDLSPMPVLVDTVTGAPILYWRSSSGPRPVHATDPTQGQYVVDANEAYFADSQLVTGQLRDGDIDESSVTAVTTWGGSDIESKSHLHPNASDRASTFSWFVVDTKLSDYDGGDAQSANDAGDVVSGAYTLMSPGTDTVYLDQRQREVVDEPSDTDAFDDIIITAGTSQ